MTTKKIIDIVVGARPNFIKVAAIFTAFKKHKIKKKIRLRLIHTGQHSTFNMSLVFFKELGLPKPSYFMKLNSKKNIASQFSQIIKKYDEFLDFKGKPILCIVVGDVNSTFATSFIAKKNNIQIAHVESGLRSFDNSMPEEINRILVDSLTDYHFVTSDYAKKNLLNSGFDKKRIYLVGNTMIDTLINSKKYIHTNEKIKDYLLVTLHRPNNVDIEDNLKKIINKFNLLAKKEKIIFALHPRTKDKIKKLKLHLNINIKVIPPQPYFNFIGLLKNSKCVITDSGGLSEEATFFNIPCITLRENTERPETVIFGSNLLLKKGINNIDSFIEKINNNKWKSASKIKFWDGNTAKRILDVINKNF